MRMEAEEYAPSSSRARWVLLALLPGLVIMTDGARSDAIAALGTGLLFGGGLLPLAAPFYLIELGRRYVRAVHGGYQSTTPFVLMASAANLVLWVGGVLMVLSRFGYR